MALPLAIPLLFAGGSLVANTIGQRKADQARADALAAERIRQQALDSQAFAAGARSREQYDAAPQQQAERSESLAQMFNAPTEAAPRAPMPVMPQSDNVVVQGRNEESAAEGRAFTDQRAEDLAEFRSFADLFGGFSRGQARAAAEADQLAGFKRGSQSVMPLELDAAAQKGAGWRLAGDALGLGASLTMGPALGGADLPGAGAGSIWDKWFGGGAAATQMRPRARPANLYTGG